MKWEISRETFRINWKVMPIKVCNLTYNLGMSLLFPYFTLQMDDLGLSLEDISFINGLIPFVTFFALPLSGLIGDKIGYRAILIIEMLVAAGISTYFAYIPAFTDAERVPVATIYKDGDVSVLASNLTGFYLKCYGDETYDDVLAAPDLNLDTAAAVEADAGMFCYASAPDLGDVGPIQSCDVVGYPGLETCDESQGDHATTFWVYFAARTVFTWAFNSVYPLLDSTGVILADHHDSDYSIMMLWSQVAITVGPFVAGYLVREPDDPDAVADTDYSLIYYVNDGMMVLTCFVVFFVNVQRMPTGEKTAASLRKMVSFPAMLFFGVMAFFGVLFGIRDSLYAIYLQDELGADDQLIANLYTIGGASGLVLLPFGNYIVRFVGEMNMCAMSVFLESARLVMYATIDQSPPNFALGLAALDSIVYIVFWLAVMTYVYKIAPPDLVSTFTATVHVILWIVMKGFGSLIGGFILGSTDLYIDDIFLIFAGGCSGCVLIIMVVYHTVGKKYERRLVEANEVLLNRARTLRSLKSQAEMEEGTEVEEEVKKEEDRVDDEDRGLEMVAGEAAVETKEAVEDKVEAVEAAEHASASDDDEMERKEDSTKKDEESDKNSQKSSE